MIFILTPPEGRAPHDAVWVPYGWAMLLEQMERAKEAAGDASANP